ncbi:leucine-rich repeat-containing protein 24-like [Athalia rosae]|uniref:leucine-rich repeat-containing protein 24-like n=1 Tax=Athalia rosae TaxID=37344 RepID=UPI002034618E|nr:leucine-rich repeat-containing protein 24-like [Athalia rosae]
MQSHTVGFLLAVCAASCTAAKCRPGGGDTPESYICEGITDHADLNTIPASARRITIVNSRIPTIQRGAFARFVDSLVSLNITNSAVSNLQAGAFTGLGELRHLILNHNEIKSIKTNWIQDLPKLETLHLWRNHINEIEPAVFDHLPQLELLDIAFNVIDHCIPPESLGKLKNLKIVYVTGNPWPLRCRPPVIFHLENSHVRLVNTWGYTHVFIEECLAHEPAAKYDDVALDKCVADHVANSRNRDHR